MAISIPIFTSQLEKSRDAVSVANMRTAYAEVVADSLSAPDEDHEKTVTTKQITAGWTGTESEIEGKTMTDAEAPKTGTVSIQYAHADGKIKIGSVAIN